jgi:thiol-disulfide isomerase/thioredoxin
MIEGRDGQMRQAISPRWAATAFGAGALVAAMVFSYQPPSAHADVALSGNNERLRFYGTELSGALFDGRSLIGKPAVIWFWTPAPDCGVCALEAPVLSRVSAANPQVTFLGIAGRWDAASMKRFVNTYQLQFTNLTDANGELWRSFGVPWPPGLAFLRPDGSGELVNNIAVPMSEDDLTARVSALTGN